MPTIRQYRCGDKEAVWELHNAALFPTGAHAGNGPWDDDLHHIEEVYLSSGGEFLVGLSGGKLVAMGALMRVSETEGEIKRMRVLPDCQRRGFGQAMLIRLEARARELGFNRLFLETTTQQVAAQGLYRKNGYREAGRHMQGRFEVIVFKKTV